MPSKSKRILALILLLGILMLGGCTSKENTEQSVDVSTQTENTKPKDEDIKVSWKDEKSVKEIRKKTDEKIRRLHKGLNDLYKHNLWINSTIFYNVCLFEYLDNKGKNILKEKYFRYLENNYSLINLDEILKESQKVVDRSKSYIKDEDLFLATINLHTLCFLLTLDILEKYQDYKEKISLIMGEKI